MVVIAQLLRRQEVLERHQAEPAGSWKLAAVTEAASAAVLIALLSWGGLKLVSHGEILAAIPTMLTPLVAQGKAHSEDLDKLRETLVLLQLKVSALEQRSSERAGQNRGQIDRLNDTLMQLMRRLGTPMPPGRPDDPDDWPFR